MRFRTGSQAGWIAICARSLAVLLFGLPAPLAEADQSSDTLKLQLEVNALSTLQDLHLTPDQLTALQALSADTAGTLPTAPLKLEAGHVAALQTLRTALISGTEEQISDAEDKVADFEEQQDADDEPDVDTTDAAKGKAGAAIKVLTPRQIAGYISENIDDVADPGEILVDALNQCHDLTEDDYQSLKEDTCDDLGQLAGGFSPSKPPSIIGKAGRFLDGARHLSADDFKTQLPTLREQAVKLGHGIDPMGCLRHWFEGEMADLLSNPQLGAALADRGVTPPPEPAAQ